MDYAVQYAELHVGESVELDENLLSGVDLSEAGRGNLHASNDGQLPVGNHRCDYLACRDVLVAAPIALQRDMPLGRRRDDILFAPLGNLRQQLLT